MCIYLMFVVSLCITINTKTSYDLLTSDWTHTDKCTCTRCVFGHVNVTGGVVWGNWGKGHAGLQWQQDSGPKSLCHLSISTETPHLIKYIIFKTAVWCTTYWPYNLYCDIINEILINIHKYCFVKRKWPLCGLCNFSHGKFKWNFRCVIMFIYVFWVVGHGQRSLSISSAVLGNY